MKENNLPSRQWVERSFMETMFPGEITIDKNACGLFLPGFPFPFYNIAQTSDPSLLDYRLYNVPWSLIRGKILSKQVHQGLCAYQRQKGLPFPLWCTLSEVNNWEFTLKKDAEGITIESRRAPVSKETWYNIDALANPLAVYRSFLEHKRLRSSCIDVVTRNRFFINDAKILQSFQVCCGTNSPFWIRAQDMHLVGAVCMPQYRGCSVHCSRGEVYNLNQMRNASDVMRRARNRWIRYKKRGALGLLDSIMEEEGN